MVRARLRHTDDVEPGEVEDAEHDESELAGKLAELEGALELATEAIADVERRLVGAE